MVPPPASPSRWAEQLPFLLARVRTHRDDAARAALWRVLHAALFAGLRAQAGRIGPVRPEDLEDLASAKALELLVQAESSSWGEADRTPGELAAYVWRVARHGLIDLARARGREAPGAEDVAGWDRPLLHHEEGGTDPVEWTAAGEFAQVLARCLDRLAPRARTAWWWRVGLERPSREIGTHLGVRPAHVDVIVQRAREALTGCMQSHGHDLYGIDARAFVRVWGSRDPGEGNT